VGLAACAGLGGRPRVRAAALGFSLLSRAGTPPLAGFVGKFYLFGAAVRAGYLWLAVIGVLNSAAAAYYYLRIIVNMYMREPEGVPAVVMPSFAGSLAVGVALWGIIQLGIFPPPLFHLAQSAALPLFRYLFGIPFPPPPPPPPPHPP